MQSTVRAPRRRYALSLYYASLSVYIGVRQPYWGLWLVSHGMSHQAAGSMATIYLLLDSAAAMVPGVLLTNRQTRRISVGLAHALLFLGTAFFLAVGGLWPFVVLSLVTGFFFGGLYHAREVFCLEYCQATEVPYGLIRIWGSVAWMASAAAAGAVLERNGLSALVLMILGAIAISFLSFGLMTSLDARSARDEPSESAERRGRVPPWQAVRRLGTLGAPYVVVVALYALIHSSQALFFLFSALHWRALGIGSTAVGVYWTIGVASGLVVFLLGQRVIDRWGPWVFLVISASMTIVRWAGMAWATGEAAFVGIQLLYGFAAAGAPLAAASVLLRTVAREDLSLAQGGLQLSGNLAMAGMLMVAGRAYEAAGAAAFLLMAAANIPALLLGPYMIWRGRPREASSQGD
jgi:PPP family 3-phenylpropionic acid transporter